MTLFAFVGHGKALNPREAGTIAARHVLDQVGREPPVIGFVFASSYLSMNQVVSGASAILGDIPLIGASTAGEFYNDAMNERSVSIALLAGEEIAAQAGWMENFQASVIQSGFDLTQILKTTPGSGTLFLAADGLYNNSIESWRDIPENYTFIGCLAGAYSRHSQTYQVGGHDCGAGGLAIAYLGPEVACGASVAHGWQPVGESFQVTEVEGLSILSLDGKTPVEAYSGLFGYPGTQWTVPPLNELVRLYPFAVQTEIEKTIVVRSPMKVEEYGVIRMQAPVSEHAFIHLMIGNREDCLAAAEKATREALNELDGAKPVLAIVLTDISWRMLMETQPGAELKTIRNIIGAEVPIVGGYVFGQLLGKSGQSAELYNQHIEVVLLGKGN